MLKEMIKAAALRAAEEGRQVGDLAKVQAALWLVRRAAGIEPLEHRSIYADHLGCVHVARTGREASLLAHQANCAYL